MNQQQQNHNQPQPPLNAALLQSLGVVMSPSRQQMMSPTHQVLNQAPFPAPPQYQKFHFKDHQLVPSTPNFSRMQPQTSSLISPPLEKNTFANSYIVTDHRINASFTMSPFQTAERVLETPAPMPIDCVLGTDTPSPSNHSSSPPLDSSEFLMMALMQDDHAGATRKRKASNEIAEKPARKRHRRTKAEIIAARNEMLKKGLKPCSVKAERIDVTSAETPVRLFQDRIISKNLPRVPRMKFVPQKFMRIDETGFMCTKKGIMYSCMTTCSFKSYDIVTFVNHLIKFHDMANPKPAPGGRKCHVCGMYTTSRDLLRELMHMIDHLQGKKVINEILYSTVKNMRQEDSDEDSDGYEDEDEEAVAGASNASRSESESRAKESEAAQEPVKSEANEAQEEALDDGAEQPLDEETSKALEEALGDCDMNGLFDDLSGGDLAEDLNEDLAEDISENLTEDLSENLHGDLSENWAESLKETLHEDSNDNLADDLNDALTQAELDPNDPDFNPEQEPQSDDEALEDLKTSEEENSEDFFSCEGDDEDRENLVTSDVSRRSRKIRSDRKRAAKLKMQALVNKVYEKKQRSQSVSVNNVSPTGDQENEDPSTETPKETPELEDSAATRDSEDEIKRLTNGTVKKQKARIHSSDDESDRRRSSTSSSRRSSTKAGSSRTHATSSDDDSTSAEDIPERNSPILTRRRVSRASKECALDSAAKKGRILNFPARSGSQSDNEPVPPTPAGSKRRRKIVPLPNSESETETETESPQNAIERNKSEDKKDESSSSDENEAQSGEANKKEEKKVEVKKEDAADSSDEQSKPDEDANFLDKMPIDMVLKIRQSITVRNTNPPQQVEGVVAEPGEGPSDPVAGKNVDLPANSSAPLSNLPSALNETTSAPEISLKSTASEPTKEKIATVTSSVASSALPAGCPELSDPISREFMLTALDAIVKEASKSPKAVKPSSQPSQVEENNNNEIVTDKEKAPKILTVAERFSQIEKKIFRADKNKSRSSQSQPTARKSTSRPTEDLFPEEGTEEFNKILENFRVRSFSIDVVRVNLDEVGKKNLDEIEKQSLDGKKKESLKLRIINASNGQLARVESTEEPENQPEVGVSKEVGNSPEVDALSQPEASEIRPDSQDSCLDESAMEIIPPVPDVPYNPSQEHNYNNNNNNNNKTVEEPIIDLEAEKSPKPSTEATSVKKKPGPKSSKNKAVKQVEPEPPEGEVSEPLQNLYPWIPSEIAAKWKKSSKAIVNMMTENSLFSTYKCMSTQCSFFSTDQDQFKEHLEKHRNVDKWFLCSFCLSDEQSPEELLEHYELRHKKDRYQCNQCMYRSTEKFYCATHQKKHHPHLAKSIYKSPVITLLKSERSKAIKKYDRKLRDKPDDVGKAIKCKFCDCKFYNLEIYSNHLKDDKNHEVKMKTNYEEVQRVRDMTVRDVCDYGLYRCLYCSDCAYNKLDMIKSHLVETHPHKFALICQTGFDKKNLDGRRAGNSLNPVIETIDVDDAPTHSMSIRDLVDPKQEKDVKVKVFKGNLEDLKTKDASDAPPMLITNVEANVAM